MGALIVIWVVAAARAESFPGAKPSAVTAINDVSRMSDMRVRLLKSK
jgi:hypothetical protein